MIRRLADQISVGLAIISSASIVQFCQSDFHHGRHAGDVPAERIETELDPAGLVFLISGLVRILLSFSYWKEGGWTTLGGAAAPLSLK
jgi:hypothetical protein